MTAFEWATMLWLLSVTCGLAGALIGGHFVSTRLTALEAKKRRPRKLRAAAEPGLPL